MIAHLDLVNVSHYDLGFTDHPVVCRRMQVRYLDEALDLVVAPVPSGGVPFCWTVESNNAVLDWWAAASPARRQLLVEQVQAGRIEVCALPFNHNPTLDAAQWECLAHWLPDELWQLFRPRTIMQNDVNGFPRAGLRALLARGVCCLWMGLNLDTGGSPVPQPSAFRWRQPDGREVFVWNSIGYPDGYFLFEATEWRRGPLPGVGDPRYCPPQPGDFFGTSPAQLQRAHEQCCRQLAKWTAQGYHWPRAAVSLTNMWRVDNDPPCRLLPAFIAAWNAAGLQPTLALTTAGRALDALRAVADDAPVLDGEWTNWWANGCASTPRELAAARRAKQLLTALRSPVYPSSPERAEVIRESTRALCFFDEHTWGSWNSVARPGSLDTKGQFAAKAATAYEPLAVTELTLGDANRALVPATPGLHVVNPFAEPFTGWVELPDDCLRGDYAGALDLASGRELAFDRRPGVVSFFLTPTSPEQFTPLDAARVFPDNIAGRCLRLWVENLAPGQVRAFRLLSAACAPDWGPAPHVETDAAGWPLAVEWPQGKLFSAEPGGFSALEVGGPFPRHRYKQIMAAPTAVERARARQEAATLTTAVPEGRATPRDTGPTLIWEQYLTHPRLRRLRRTLEVWKHSPFATLELVLDRTSRPEAAEVFYVGLPLALPDGEVLLSNGGLTFRPGVDQLPHSCGDFYAIDGRVRCRAGDVELVVESRDSALAALGGRHDGLMRETPGEEPGMVYAIVYNNVWYTNFAGDETGEMTFRFAFWQQQVGASGWAPEAFPVVNCPSGAADASQGCRTPGTG